MSVSQLGYVAIESAAPAQWRDVASEVLALEAVADHAHGVEGAQYYRMDEQHHRVTIYHGARNALRHMGWQLESRSELEDCIESLRSAGITATHEPPEVAAERMVRELASFDDAAGFRHEIYWGPVMGARPFMPSRPISGFVTGSQGLGHVVLCAHDQKGLVQFFKETLGFRLSDTINLGGIDIAFLRCNERHHSLAIMSAGQGIEAGQMHHVMFELNSLDDVGRAYDVVRRRDTPLILTLGRHVNDRMISFYFRSPSVVGIELGTGARTIPRDDRWEPTHYDYAEIWGHEFVGQPDR
jgi:extradiol dioxygenase